MKFNRNAHMDTCAICRKAKDVSGLCNKAQDFINQDHVYSRENPYPENVLEQLQFKDWQRNQGEIQRSVFSKLESEIDLSILTPSQQRCVELYFWEGLTYREIAKELGYSNVKTAWLHVKAGLARLKQHLLSKVDEQTKLLLEREIPNTGQVVGR